MHNIFWTQNMIFANSVSVSKPYCICWMNCLYQCLKEKLWRL